MHIQFMTVKYITTTLKNIRKNITQGVLIQNSSVSTLGKCLGLPAMEMHRTK